ncbi:hypothetical protein VTO73DRAFT_2938 [Trametes versicolor]
MSLSGNNLIRASLAWVESPPAGVIFRLLRLQCVYVWSRLDKRGTNRSGTANGLFTLFPQRGMNATTDGSDSQWELVEEIAEGLEMSRPINYVNLAVFVVLLFEYFITIDCEVRLAWGRKLSWARTICLLNRYFAILLSFLSLVPLLPAGNLI